MYILIDVYIYIYIYIDMYTYFLSNVITCASGGATGFGGKIHLGPSLIRNCSPAPDSALRKPLAQGTPPLRRRGPLTNKAPTSTDTQNYMMS